MAYTMLDVTWHTRCSNMQSSIRNTMDRNDIHNARWTYTNMNGPQPHSHQWPRDEKETTEMRAHVHAYREPNLRHKMPLYQSMAGDERWHTNM